MCGLGREPVQTREFLARGISCSQGLSRGENSLLQEKRTKQLREGSGVRAGDRGLLGSL